MGNQMHILILPMFYPEKDSSSHRGYMFMEQAREIALAGCKTAIVFVEQRPTRKFTPVKFLRESHFQTSIEDNGLFITLRMHAWNPKLSTQRGGHIWSWLTLKAIHTYISRFGKPDLIHAHFGIWAGYAAARIKERYGIPFVITEHASSLMNGNIPGWQQEIYPFIYNNARKIICVGTLLADKIKPFVKEAGKIMVIPNFVDTSTFRPSGALTQKENKFTFISVANLTRLKGFDDLIVAFDRAFRDNPQVKLVIAGDGEERKSLENKANKLVSAHRIVFMGKLSRKELAEHLALSDAFVLASYTETFGIVFIEAMAAGLPVIGTTCGGPEDIVLPGTGYLVPPGNVEALSVSMKKLFDNYESFDKKNIRKIATERFDFSYAGKHLKKIYTEALNDEDSSSR